ncbi:MAG: hypothetical protein ACW9W4_01105 [Candidatus Nitrosopumilus sp. bin_7KS]
MNFGKKLAIIGLIIFGVGVPSTAISMSSPLFDPPFGMQYGATIDGIVLYPNEDKNIKHTFRGHNPVLVSFEVNPQEIPYSVIVTNYEWSNEVLNTIESGSTEHKIDYARVGTYDFDFVNLGDDELYLSIEIKDAKYDEFETLHQFTLPMMIYIYYTVFFGGIIIGSIGIIVWKRTK